MDEQPSNENPSTDFNKLDLSQLQGFSFGTQWTQDKAAPSRGGDRDRDRAPRRADDRDRARDSERPRRDGDRPRRDGGGDSPRRDAGDGAQRRDRRIFRRPASGDSDSGATPSAPPDAAPPDSPAEGRPDRRPQGQAGDRPPRRDQRDQREGGDYRDQRPPRRDFREGDRGPRREGDARHGGYRGPARHERESAFRAPYISPHYTITFYPDDTGFGALVKAMRLSCRTYELFEIARVVVGKNDRFIASIQRKQPDAPRPQPQKQKPRADEAGATSDAGRPASPAPAKLPPLAISVPDGLVFENEDAALAHVIGNHLGTFFDTAEVEVEPPKGNFQVVNKCGITGALLGPPNYHRYNQIVQQHHATRVTRMGFESFRARIETIRDPEVVQQWLEKMKKTTRYTWRLPAPAAPAGGTPEAQSITFDSFEEARAYLVENAWDKMVKLTGTARMSGRLLEKLPQGEIRRAVEGWLDRQRRFPLETANALRGRLRRENFAIYKKGSKGVSYVCAVKRKYRIPGQVFADSIGALIAFIEANPMVKASELPSKFLGLVPAGAAQPKQATPVAQTADVARTANVAQTADVAQTAKSAIGRANPPGEPLGEPRQEQETAQPEASPYPAGVPDTEQAAETDETSAVEAATDETPVAETPAAETPVAETLAPESTTTLVEAPVAEQAVDAPVAEQAVGTPASTETAIAPATSGSVAPFATTTRVLSAEEQAKLYRLTVDLRWLVSEGYVTEFVDGRLFAAAVMTEARKREVEKEEHDPENFPDAPPAVDAAAIDAADADAADVDAAAADAADVAETADAGETAGADEIVGESGEPPADDIGGDADAGVPDEIAIADTGAGDIGVEEVSVESSGGDNAGVENNHDENAGVPETTEITPGVEASPEIVAD